MRECIACGALFERAGKSKRVTCSRSCAVATAWLNNPGKRIASIQLARRTPESRALSTATNNARWNRPGARDKLSEWNKKRWANPWIKRMLSGAISKAWTPEKRAQFSDIRREEWARDATYRAATVAGIRRSKQSPQARAQFSLLLKTRWQDPVWRARWTEGTRRRMSQPEERQKFSVNMKRRWDDPVWRAKIIFILADSRSRGLLSGPRIKRGLLAVNVPPRDVVMVVAASRPNGRGFSMLAMQGRDPMRTIHERQAVQAGIGRVTPVMGHSVAFAETAA